MPDLGAEFSRIQFPWSGTCRLANAPESLATDLLRGIATVVTRASVLRNDLADIARFRWLHVRRIQRQESDTSNFKML
ncbi:hypothetical protein RSSM_06326 [Rhodopirellula sallentina SM41]|uniref:Uncharacterized protein n=1 Tax=Rhodopirellula sallentina SM41 TaxID=1263870 RepID=M5TSQ9_9BACT|nr:hypothetical protein RSSM_06326 [Rhodopirellula sallentina SM41]